MLIKKILLPSITALGLLFVANVSQALTAEQQKGLDISTEAKKRDLGWQDSTADMLMLLRNKQGQESVREIKIKSLEVDNDGDKSLTIFNKPRDVKGTAFLSFSDQMEYSALSLLIFSKLATLLCSMMPLWYCCPEPDPEWLLVFAFMLSILILTFWNSTPTCT